jgi:hypothetical protein
VNCIPLGPREFGKTRSTWTVELAAEVCFEQKLTEKRVSDETIRQALLRLGVQWQRARDLVTSPDPEYLLKKRRDRLIRWAEAHPEWVLGYVDEVWWSRLAQPRLHT